MPAFCFITSLCSWNFRSKKEKDIREPKWIGVYDSFQQNKCIGLIPETSSQNQILNFIESHHNASNCYLGKETTEIKMSETFVVFVENKGDDKHLECEYFINKVEFYKQ